MELRHVGADEPDGSEGRRLASDVEFAETVRQKAKGLMFREEVPEEYALVFEFSDPPGVIPNVLTGFRSIHMLFVTVPLDVLWLRDDEVQQVSTLRPWMGLGIARADTVVEMTAGAAADVAVGDTVRIVDDE